MILISPWLHEMQPTTTAILTIALNAIISPGVCDDWQGSRSSFTHLQPIKKHHETRHLKAHYEYSTLGYIIPGNAPHWKWKVRARVNGDWNDWSAEQSFEVEPVQTDCRDRNYMKLRATTWLIHSMAIAQVSCQPKLGSPEHTVQAIATTIGSAFSIYFLLVVMWWLQHIVASALSRPGRVIALWKALCQWFNRNSGSRH